MKVYSRRWQPLLGCIGLFLLVMGCRFPDPSAVGSLVHEIASTPIVTATPTTSPTIVGGTEDFGKVAYVRDGEIWVTTLPVGEQRQLTHDGRVREPRWSPSGHWLAYRRDVELWVLNTQDGTSMSVGAPVMAFAWSPVDERLAYVIGSGVLRLEVLNVVDGRRVALIPWETAGTGQVGRIAWRPDGREIAYEWRQGLRYQGLWSISVEGGAATELYVSGLPQKGEAALAGWTSDGSYLLFWQGPFPSMSLYADGAALYALPVGGGKPILLADEVLLHSDFVAPRPGAAPGAAVVVGSGRGAWTRKRIQILLLPNKGHRFVTSPQMAASSPVWAPGGQALAYVVMPDRGDLVGGDAARDGLMLRRIWRCRGDGENARQLTHDPTYRDEYPLWSVDGAYLLFARMDAKGAASLWLMPAEGGEPRPVVDELGPIPGPAEGWFGFYGHIDWTSAFDWWRPEW